MDLTLTTPQRMIGALLPLSLLTFSPSALAQEETCTPLSVVGSPSQTEVSKKVSLPSFLVTNTNWNTDFAVPSDASYSRFLVTITPTLGTNYDLAVNLKYSDDTVDGVYQEDGVTLPLTEPYVIEAPARTGETPYQVNILVGGPDSVENEYTASVMGCVD